MHLHLMYLLIHKPICNQLGCQNQIWFHQKCLRLLNVKMNNCQQQLSYPIL
jgi:hypothetical protein